jgi:hypothetical protein
MLDYPPFRKVKSPLCNLGYRLLARIPCSGDLLIIVNNLLEWLFLFNKDSWMFLEYGNDRS